MSRIGRAARTAANWPAIALFLLALAGPAAAADEPADAGQFLAELSERAVDRLTEPGIGEAEKERRFRALIAEGFDLPSIARFVIGRYWRAAEPAEQEAFLAAFEDLIVYRFLPLFGDYSGESLEVGAVRPFAGSEDYFDVESRVTRPDGPPISVHWRLRALPEGSYRIVDIVAEGVSIAVTLRSEYGSVLKQNGGDLGALAKTLRERVAGLAPG